MTAADVASRSAGQPLNRTQTCGYCGRAFRPDPAQAACRSCPLSTACRYVRCPDCGYENPVEPSWLGALRRLVAR